MAKPLDIPVLEAAAGIRQIIDQRMADLIRRVTLERGYDPQDFVLYAYGGAGPMHCASFGKELRLSRIVIPLTAGSHSAFGAVAGASAVCVPVAVVPVAVLPVAGGGSGTVRTAGAQPTAAAGPTPTGGI